MRYQYLFVIFQNNWTSTMTNPRVIELSREGEGGGDLLHTYYLLNLGAKKMNKLLCYREFVEPSPWVYVLTNS